MAAHPQTGATAHDPGFLLGIEKAGWTGGPGEVARARAAAALPPSYTTRRDVTRSARRGNARRRPFPRRLCRSEQPEPAAICQVSRFTATALQKGTLRAHVPVAVVRCTRSFRPSKASQRGGLEP
jgi:hypothetical protein